MIDAIRPFLARAIGLLVAWLAGHLAVRYGINVADTEQAALADAIVNTITVIIGIYFSTHRIASKWINPGDAAGSHLAAQEQQVSDALKKDVSGVSP